MEFTTMLGMLGEGFLVTLQLFFVTLIGALPLGVLVALGRMSRFRPISYLFRLYISIMRGTPLMLQLMFIFFSPYYIFGVQLSMDWKFGACAVAFIMNYSAYFAEIYRSGIQSIPRGQYEAAEILGYSKAQTFLRIIFPQVFKRIVPALGNEVIVLVKDTSLAFTIGVMEMFTVARALVSAQATMLPFVFAGVMYYILNAVVAAVMAQIEKKMNYFR